jgi:hypothetical protein
MKQFYVEHSWGNVLLDAKTLKDAKSEVAEDYANCGDMKIVCVVFKKIESKEYIVNTDWNS